MLNFGIEHLFGEILLFGNKSNVVITFCLTANSLADCSEKKNATELLIEYVDRGVHNWDEFGKKLSADYPALKLLFISQNYSYNTQILRMYNETVESYNMRVDCQDTNDFLSFLQTTKLSVFALRDFQSSFLQSMDPIKIFDAQPDGSLYSIVLRTHNTIPRGTFHLENKQENKQLFFHVRRNKDNEWWE